MRGKIKLATTKKECLNKLNKTLNKKTLKKCFMLEAVLVLNSEIRLNIEYFKPFIFLLLIFVCVLIVYFKNVSRLDM